MSILILVRHGESEWNASEKLTGQADVLLTEVGKKQAEEVGDRLRDLHIDIAYISELIRTTETLVAIQARRNTKNLLPIVRSAALNERSFGTLTGEKKSDVIASMCAEAYTKMLKGWDVSAPEGESLEMVYERVIPYFKRVILKDLRDGKNILVVSHHQSLRSLIKYFENISHDEIADIKLGNAEAIIYSFNPSNEELRKQVT
jgi:2,3-bisphosphoglycerate-dependent phosphoglycerate mutase